jgi:response regulator of citrate/malate metabolism
MNLLIIDDDSICSFVNIRVAQTSGIFKQIRSVHNVKDALDVIEQATKDSSLAPDVILLDLNMPILNGFDFIQAFQNSSYPNKERLSIVILTSSDNSIDIERARTCGVNHYLKKPLTVNELQTTIFSLKRNPER